MILVMLVVGVSAYLYSRRMANQRREEFEHLAKGRGWQFTPSIEPEQCLEWGAFPLFERGSRGSRRATNLITCEMDGMHVVLFDYRFVTGSGKNRTRHDQSVICLRSDRLKLPSFELRPEHFGHKIASVFGFKDIDFDASPEFSSRYLLRGENESRVRTLFGSNLRRHLEDASKRSFEGLNDRLLVYQQRKRCKPEEAVSLIRDVVSSGRQFQT
jgi:hypothetical protein